MLNPIRLPQRARSIISSWFHHFGIHCASHPKRVILISCVVITSLFYPALALYSSSNPPSAFSSLYSLFNAYQSDLHEIWEGYQSLHVLEDGATKVRCGQERTLRIERVLIPSAEWTSTGAATPSTLQMASKLDDSIRSILSSADPLLSCVRTPNNDCFILSPQLLFENDISSTPAGILKAINMFPNISVSGVPIGVPMVFLARYSRDDTIDTKIEHIGFLALTYFFLEKDCMDPEGHERWLRILDPAASDSLGSVAVTPFVLQKPRFLALQYDSSLSRPSHFSAISLFLYLSYLGVFLSFSGSLRRMDTVHSRFGLTFTALVEIIASTITSVSVCALVGFRITMVPWGILPVIIVFVGAENMFLLVDAVTSTSVTLPLKQRVGTGLAVAGTTNTLNTISYNTILGVIAFFAAGAIRQFCSFAIVLLVAHWFLIHTFFVAVLSIDLQRLELSDMLSQDKASKPAVPPTTLKIAEKPPPSKRRQAMKQIQQRLRVLPAKNGSLVLMLAVTATLYYVTYSFPTSPKNEADPLSFLQHTIQRSPPLVEDYPSPALNLWKILNPRPDPLVHIRIETPMIVASNAQDASAPRREGHRQDMHGYAHIARRTFWLLKIVIFPIGTTTGLLYLLLLYLLKDADLLEAQRNRPEAGSKETPNIVTPVDETVTFMTLPRAFATDVMHIAINHDASVIAVASTDDELVVWNGGYNRLNTCEVPFPGSSVSGGHPCITAVALDYHGRYCAIGTVMGTVVMWRTSAQGQNDSLPITMAVTGSITDLLFIPTGQGQAKHHMNTRVMDSSNLEQGYVIVVACDNGTAFQIGPGPCTTIHVVHPSHTATVLRSHLLRTSNHHLVYIAYTFHDGAVEVFTRTEDGYTWKTMCVMQIGNSMDPVTVLCLNTVFANESPVDVLGAATSAGVVALWDPAKGERIILLDNSYGAVGRMRIAPIPAYPCHRCGERKPDAFMLTFSVGHAVYVYRASMPFASKRCTCPVTRNIFAHEGFGQRSRSGSMASSTSSSPSRTRLKLPPIPTSATSANAPAFPISGHGVHSRRAGSEKDTIRRVSESLPTIHSQSELLELPLPFGLSSEGLSNTALDPIWRDLILDLVIDINCERGSWDLIDGQQMIGLRRRSRLQHKCSSPTVPVPVGKGELTSLVLERWELWTFNPTKPDAGVRASSLLTLSPASSTMTRGSLYPRLPFTRVSPMVVSPSVCVAGFGNTTGVIDLSHHLAHKTSGTFR